MTKIGGEKGDANGETVLEPLIHAIIVPQMLTKISWTGRAGRGKEKKVVLSKYGNILSLITSLCELADRTYKPMECTEHIKHRVLKYAAKYLEENSSAKSKDNIS